MNEILSFLRTLPRRELLRRIRQAAGDDGIVFWEQVAYSDMYAKVTAGPQTAAKLGVPVGTVIGYRILAGTRWVAEVRPTGTRARPAGAEAAGLTGPPAPRSFGPNAMELAPTRRLGRLVLAATLILAAAPQSIVAQTSADSQAVTRAFAHYQDLVRRMAHDSIAALYAPDGQLLVLGRPPVVGPDSIRTYLRGFSSYRVVADTMSPQSLDIHGDTAIQVGTFWQHVQIPSGDTMVVGGGFRLIWIRSPAGRWEIWRLGTTSPPQPPLHPTRG
ncbi:MAG TPA: nuclear transport factor 2 family protein [Gemmatimonadales bacterium]|nr:nuclear transport factor 2 family protein [Gemmatimonadales bacterium]